MGLAAGFLGFGMEDERMKHALEIARESGMVLEFHVIPYENNHPNTYKMTLTGADGDTIDLLAISTGGGMIEFTGLDGFPVSSLGDYHEAYIVYDRPDSAPEDSRLKEALRDMLEESGFVDEFCMVEKGKQYLLNMKSSTGPLREFSNLLKGKLRNSRMRFAGPVMPVLCRRNLEVPFLTAADALRSAEGMQSWEVAAHYESCRSDLPVSEVLDMMEEIVRIMDQSIQQGLKGTEYTDRILGRQSHLIGEAAKEGKLIGGSLVNGIISSIMAMMEVKSALGVIVAAPTAGSCGTLPGTVITTGRELGLNHTEMAKAMLVAGLVGIFIAGKSTFAAELAGCQAECGSATGMTAAALVQMKGGSLGESFDAASMAFQNIFGLACDPVANRVEVPCLGKNIMAGVNALSSANLALAGVDAVIPLDEVITAMDKTGRSLPYEIRCTGYGGLSVTPTAIRLEDRLKTGNGA